MPFLAFLDRNLADVAAMNFVGSRSAGFLFAVTELVPRAGAGAEYNPMMFSRHFVLLVTL